jgi:hypothetical protein
MQRAGSEEKAMEFHARSLRQMGPAMLLPHPGTGGVIFYRFAPNRWMSD